MHRTCNTVALALVALGAAAACSNPAMAQLARRATGLRFFLQPAVAIAQLEEVQAELKLSDEQKSAVAKLNAELNEKRMAIFQNAAGDWDAIREGVTKLYREMHEKFVNELDDSQRTRMQELYLQVNGPLALQSDELSAALKLTDEQQQKLEEARNESRDAFMNAGLRDMSEEDAAKKVEELLGARDERLLAVLTDEQRTEFQRMKGEKLEIDLSKMPGSGLAR